MVSLYLASSHSYSGKTLLGLALGRHYKEKGLRVGYFRPIGALPVVAEGGPTDEDVLFIKEQLELQEPAELLCPVILTEELLSAYMRGEANALEKKISEAFQQASQDKDLMLVGGVGQALSLGTMLGLSAMEMAALLDLKVLLIGTTESLFDLDGVLATAKTFGSRLAGIMLNRVPPERMEFFKGKVIPYIEGLGFKVLGALPQDGLLHSISVRELAESLQARVLCAEEMLGELVEHFRIGAMSLESALAHFRLTEHKAVITGGDRSDIILAALQTPTVCLILTGNLDPSPAVRSRAAELGVPMLLVAEDTNTTVANIEAIVARLRVREPRKLQRAKKLIETCIDLTALDALIGAA